ncbi:hypothetical protein WJX84_008092 [Apatococcus fuscideae]|uniref:J domain-containing protein n=1 Tax=Apatococcus fuscideae TaxID=2026836 RepID=A0AAW1SVB5_9CHLO
MRSTYYSLCILLLSFLIGPAIAGKDYYELLQVPRGADEQVIKRSYKKLALANHPDKVSGGKQEKEKAAKRFSEISTAYESGGGGGGGGPGDIFSQFFGGGGGPFGGFGALAALGEAKRKKNRYQRVLMCTSSLRSCCGISIVGNTFTVKRDKKRGQAGKGQAGSATARTSRRSQVCHQDGARHPGFLRKGNDLYLNATISLTDALVGFSTEVEHLDGHKLIKDEGIAFPDQAKRLCNLYVTYTVAFPKKLSSVQQASVREVFKGLTHEEL